MRFAWALVVIAGARAQGVNCSAKLTEAKVEALLSGGVPQARVEQIARSCGITFDVTPAVASHLRQSGAGSPLIGALRSIQPKLEEHVLKPGLPQPLQNPRDGQIYLWIPAGTFMIGCSHGDLDCGEDEKPPHREAIGKAFRLGKTEVTQSAYAQVTGNNPSNFKGSNLPVEEVSWAEAKNYCEAIGGRLPSEAEWEYAARGGTTGARYGELASVAWFLGNSGNATHPVAEKEPNKYGLYDMLGNVLEWVDGFYPGTQDRVLRGGSWYSVPRGSRASYRVRVDPGFRYNGIGFRCAWDQP